MNDELKEPDYAASIRAARSTRWLGRPLHYYAEVTSTNDLLLKFSLAEASAGTMVVADYQSHGKGRLGRRWLAPAGTSLLFSVLFRPSWPPGHVAWLTMIAGLAAVQAIESLSRLSPQLKWPNDLILTSGNHWSKVGGVLLETQLTQGRLNAAILGIGINVNIKPEQLPAAHLPATSLLKESGSVIDRATLLGEILTRLESGYDAAEQGHSPRHAWQDKLATLGQRIIVSQSGNRQPLVGIAERTDETGHLIVRDDAGREHTVSAGDVTLQVDNSED